MTRLSTCLTRVLPVLLALAACDLGGEPSTTSASGTSTSGTTADTTSDSSSPTSTSTSMSDTASQGDVPAELVGTWTWVTGSGSHSLAFTAEGEYTSDVFLDAHPGDSCGTEYFTHYAGVAMVTGDTLTLTSSVATRKKVDSCSDTVVSDEAIDGQVQTYAWRLVDDAGCSGVALALTDADSTETRYCAEAG